MKTFKKIFLIYARALPAMALIGCGPQFSAILESNHQESSFQLPKFEAPKVSDEVDGVMRRSNLNSSVLSSGVSAIRLSQKVAGLNSNSNLVIERTETVVIDTDINVAELTINGSLACSNSLTRHTLKAQTIYVNGLFECGANTNERFANNLTIKLKDNGAVGKSTRRGLLINRGGTLKMFGQERNVEWQRIAATAAKGAQSLTLEKSVLNRWAVGDQIVLGATGFETSETEMLTIQKISADGKVISFSPALKFSHYGVTETFRTKQGSVTLDERAEISNLTRNIRIMPDEDSGVITDSNGIGAHVMSMPGGFSYIDAVEAMVSS